MLGLLSRFFKKKSTAAPEHLIKGQNAEAAAAQYIKKTLRYKILAQNWTFKKGELDIIARDGPNTVFIEVRARQENALVSGYHSITAAKKKLLKNTAYHFLKQQNPRPQHFRFDIIEIKLSNTAITAINHYKSIPLFANSQKIR